MACQISVRGELPQIGFARVLNSKHEGVISMNGFLECLSFVHRAYEWPLTYR